MTEMQMEIWGDFACFTRPESKIERIPLLLVSRFSGRTAQKSAEIKNNVTPRGWRIDLVCLPSWGVLY